MELNKYKKKKTKTYSVLTHEDFYLCLRENCVGVTRESVALGMVLEVVV